MAALSAPDTLKTQLESIGTPLSKKQGTFLFRHGDRVVGAFLITKGAVRLGLEKARRGLLSRELSPGSVVGLPATLSDSTYSLTAEVIEDSEFIFIPAGTLNDLLRQQPQLCFDVMQILTEELTETRAALEWVHRRGKK
jgi:CRP-like cAMP-binding protein